MKKESQTYSQLKHVFNKGNFSTNILYVVKLGTNDNLSVSKKISIYNK